MSHVILIRELFCILILFTDSFLHEIFKVNKEMRNFYIGELISFNYNFFKGLSQLECIELRKTKTFGYHTWVCFF